jgi:formamidopyrimidine-DNA glycosylase
MPELAEVALFARDMSAKTRGTRLKSLKFPNRAKWGNVIIPRTSQLVLKELIGKRINFSSTGKTLQILVDNKHHYSPVLEFRLGMTGGFQLKTPNAQWRHHCFVEFIFDSFSLYYVDPRRFSRTSLPMAHPFSIGGFDPKIGFWTKSKPSPPSNFEKKSRLTWLLNTGGETGVGNYMANEALGRLNFSPFEPCQSRDEAAKLLSVCTEIARESFHHGGNSFSSGYFQLDGTEGRYSEQCKFYQNPEVPRRLYRGRPIFTYF